MSESFKRPLQSSTSPRNMNQHTLVTTHTLKPPSESASIKNVSQSVRRKGCNCKKSGCLKLYCECFASNVRCGERCQCLGCKNHQHNEEEIARAIDAIEKRTQKPFRSTSCTIPSSASYQYGSTSNSTTTTTTTTITTNATTQSYSSSRTQSHHISIPNTRPFSVSNNSTISNTKGCSCKKSGCLKLYCECLAAQKYCDSKCHCEGCKNHPEMFLEREKAIASILERNPMAFQPKVGKTTTTTTSNQQEQKQIVMINLRGCNCRKSNCMKNYCECHQAGVACTSRCACHECRNTENFVSAKKMLVFNTPERQMKKKNQPLSTPSSAPAYLNTTSRLHTFAAHISSRLEPSSARPLPPPRQQLLYDRKTSPLTPLLEAAMATTRVGEEEEISNEKYMMMNVPNSAPVPGYKRRYEEMMKHHRRGGQIGNSSNSSGVRRKRMAALQLQLEKIEEEELHQSEKQEEQEEQEEEEEEEEEKEEKEKNDRNEKKKDIENGTKSRNHMKSHLVARVELPPIDKTLEAGRKTMTKLCSSLLHAAMAVDADTPTPTPSTTPKSLTTVTATSSINQEKKKKTSEEEEEKQEVVVEIAAGSMSPSTQELLCAEYIDKENEEELEEVKPTQNSLAKSHGLGSSAVQERAILQEFSVWIRNIATNE